MGFQFAGTQSGVEGISDSPVNLCSPTPEIGIAFVTPTYLQMLYPYSASSQYDIISKPSDIQLFGGSEPQGNIPVAQRTLFTYLYRTVRIYFPSVAYVELQADPLIVPAEP